MSARRSSVTRAPRVSRSGSCPARRCASCARARRRRRRPPRCSASDSTALNGLSTPRTIRSRRGRDRCRWPDPRGAAPPAVAASGDSAGSPRPSVYYRTLDVAGRTPPRQARGRRGAGAAGRPPCAPQLAALGGPGVRRLARFAGRARAGGRSRRARSAPRGQSAARGRRRRCSTTRAHVEVAAEQQRASVAAHVDGGSPLREQLPLGLRCAGRSTAWRLPTQTLALRPARERARSPCGGARAGRARAAG